MGNKRAKDVKAQKRSFARAFVTKAQACRKLNIRVRDFRRLCILKGIYPRHPKKIPEVNKKAGLKAGSTFYFNKDINWLMEDPILETFRQFHHYGKKLQRHIGRGDIAKAKNFKLHNKPEYSIVHCVKERYPTFLEAIRDMDDALSHVYLYSQLPAHIASKTTIEGHSYLTTGMSAKSKMLAKRFNDYVVRTKGLRKSFISVKGIYYQADVLGQTVTWLVPHHYTVSMPGEVDYHTMITFLEFYLVQLDFILFRLENDRRAEDAKKKTEEDADEDVVEDDTAEDFPISAEDQKLKEETEKIATLFKGFTFCINTEVPFKSFKFLIKAMGGYFTTDLTSPKITHHVFDRPTVKDPVPGRDYVQPQWVVDCLNCKHVLPVDQYAPGKDLPPHLSPFDDAAVADHEGRMYEPQRLKELQDIMDPTFRALAKPAEEEEDDEIDEDDEGSLSEADSLPDARMPDDGIVTDDDDDDEKEEGAGPGEESKAAKDTSAESAGKQKKDKAEYLKIAEQRKLKNEKEEKRMRSLLLSNKKRKLWEKVTRAHAKKDREVKQLDDKRKRIEAGEIRVEHKGYLVDLSRTKKGKNKRKKGPEAQAKKKALQKQKKALKKSAQ
uniref:Pescadillo homolog n=1 Tax=Eutreptiella gymnastica TaxID=73025 RepID=A0A7S1I7A5_9EUGL|mmetsp:Transcript_13572/g.24194  ORF Transcript_13572/g.24194 Transcript_13572/m.24194 type:complete len:609 (+) Transcript_13572:89-1915(+)